MAERWHGFLPQLFSECFPSCHVGLYMGAASQRCYLAHDYTLPSSNPAAPPLVSAGAELKTQLKLTQFVTILSQPEAQRFECRIN